MLRHALPTLLFLTAPLLAQHRDPSLVQPVGVPLQDAGVLDLGRRAWRPPSPGGLESPSTVVYNNSCTWFGGVSYLTAQDCEDVYDEGRVPSTSDPGAPTGALDEQQISRIEIAYCTAFPTGSVRIEVAFWDHNGGSCLGSIPQKPLPNGAKAYYDLSNLGLPGSATGGGQLSCWTVTIDLSNTFNGGFCLLSDGDGAYDDNDSDRFNWAFAHDMDNSLFGIASGPVLAADPLVSAFGSCTYNIPCGTDANWGHACGTGLSTSDEYWMNVDGTRVGGPPNPLTCPTGSLLGSNCYTFGYPATPFASLWLVMESSGACQGGQCAVFYCGYSDPSTKTSCGTMQCPSSSGCQARISTSNPQACPVSSANDYQVTFSGAEVNKPCILFYGYGRFDTAFSSGTLCVKPPLKRTAPASTGYQGSPCTGSHALVINDPATVDHPPGSTVNFQGWMRDPMASPGTDVTDAVELTYQ